jgi:hypothetical protein
MRRDRALLCAVCRNWTASPRPIRLATQKTRKKGLFTSIGKTGYEARVAGLLNPSWAEPLDAAAAHSSREV